MTQVGAVPGLVAKSTPPVQGWRGELQLRFEGGHPRTLLKDRRHVGPLVVQRPFYPEPNGCCHVYLVHPPGGVVGGDELRLTVALEREAHALITTPAATKLYRSAGPRARLEQHLTVAAGSRLEWLPQETIAFSGSRASVLTRIRLEPGASFLGWEVTCLGRPASGEAFTHGELEQCLELELDGTPLLRERVLLSGGGPELEAPWGMGGHTTLATLAAIRGDERWQPQQLRPLIARLRTLGVKSGQVAITQVSGVLLCRYLGDGAENALGVLRQAWELIRPEVFQCPATQPRIWAT